MHATSLPRAYLDNAATSWPKPEAVYRAVDRYQREIGVAAGRGAYHEAVESTRLVDSTRRSLAALLGARNPHRIVFTANGTDALNLALHGLLDQLSNATPKTHVITSVLEHNSVLRPLFALEAAGRIEVTRLPCPSGRLDPADVRHALRPETRLVALTHASNVTGAVQPIAEVGEIARKHGALMLVDAAQTAGELPIQLSELPVDLLAAPGHKALLGPLGTGVLYVGERADEHLAAMRQGGTGTVSDEEQHPRTLPERLEAGNLNVPGIAGLGAGVAYLRERGIAAVEAHVSKLTAQLLEGLAGLPKLQIHGPMQTTRQSHARVGIVSITVAGYDPQELASLLDASFHVQVRAGLHCAPRAHAQLKTLVGGGTVRLSIGALTTEENVRQAVDALQAVTTASSGLSLN